MAKNIESNGVSAIFMGETGEDCPPLPLPSFINPSFKKKKKIHKKNLFFHVNTYNTL